MCEDVRGGTLSEKSRCEGLEVGICSFRFAFVVVVVVESQKVSVTLIDKVLWG